MKAVALLAITLAVLSLSKANNETDMRNFIIDFYMCYSCHEDPAFIEEHRKCHEMKSEKCKKIGADCHAEVFPGTSSLQEQMAMACKNENDEITKTVDCKLNHDLRKEMNEDDMHKQMEFTKCIQNLYKKYCSH